MEPQRKVEDETCLQEPKNTIALDSDEGSVDSNTENWNLFVDKSTLFIDLPHNS
jgi:hypothetical protein